ncbi:MAG: hypothetical protein H7338_05790 [Candidatus Sericytochromatia bacterium]|nr:hypothetical protein [Candidatus Sericytochromatia bacterium]
MRLQPWILAACLSLGVVGTAQSAHAASLPFSADEAARIDKGDVVVTIGPAQGSLQLYQVAGTVAGTQPQIYRMLTDFNGHAKIFSKVKTSVIQKRLAADHVIVRKDLDLWPLSGKWVLSDTTLKPGQFGYNWKSIDGNVGNQHGSYETQVRNGKSLLVYQIWFDMAKNPLPTAVFNQGQKIALPGVIADCRKAVARY